MDFNSKMKFLSLLVIGAVALTVAGFYYFSMSEEMQSQKIKLEPNDINLVTAGRTVYLQNCASCHDLNMPIKNKIGPSLANVLNRKIGSLSDYKSITESALFI